MENGGSVQPGRLRRQWNRLADVVDGSLRKKIKAHFLYLEVTHRCNLRCISCYTGAGSEKPDSLTLKERKLVVRQAKAMGVRSVSLSGSGEPLLYPDLGELIAYIRSLGMSVVLFTNGTLLTPEIARFLLERQVVIYVKLFSLEPQVVDRLVGRQNAYHWVDYVDPRSDDLRSVKIPQGLKHLLDAWEQMGRPDLVRAEALIARINSPSLPEVARFCRRLGIGFYLETPVFTGRALEHMEELAMDQQGYRALFEELEAIQGAEALQGARVAQCPVEKNPAVWTNGDLALCSCRSARVGNVREGSLQRLYRKARKLRRLETRRLAKDSSQGDYFRRCNARKLYEERHNLPCDY